MSIGRKFKTIVIDGIRITASKKLGDLIILDDTYSVDKAKIIISKTKLMLALKEL